MSTKYAIDPSIPPTTTLSIPNFFSKRTPFYTNPKERNFLQEVLSANQSILGTSMFVVLYVGIILGVHGSLPMSRIGSDGTPVSEGGNVCLILPMMLVGYVFGNATFRDLGRAIGMKCGAITWSYEIGQRFLLSVAWPSYMKAAILVIAPFMMLAYSSDNTIITFYNLELPAMIVFVIVGFLIFAKPTNAFLLKERIIDNVKAEALTRRNSVRRASQAALTIVYEPTTTNMRHSGLKEFFAFMTNLLIFLAYPFTVITLFRSLGV